MSHIPSVPIPNPEFSPNLDAGIRRTRHETLLSLSQTSRSLRSFFLFYLWQRIEVRKGMKVRDEDNLTLGGFEKESDEKKNYRVELVRQLEIVTVRNPQLAQHVNYLDVFVSDDAILPYFAHCLSFLSNLHTVRFDITRIAEDNVKRQAFKKYSYPQIRNIYITASGLPLIASCPEARRVSPWMDPFMWRTFYFEPYLDAIFDHCPRIEVLEDFRELRLFCTVDTCKRIVNGFPNLRTITVTPLAKVGHHIDILNELNYLQTIILSWVSIPLYRFDETALDGIKKDWPERLKHVLIQVGLRDNLEKTLVIEDLKGESKVLIKPIDFKGSF